MKKYKDIVILAAVHGDEPTGVQVVSLLKKLNLPNVRTIIANPKALELNKRFLETDLNRSSLKINPISYEEKRSYEIHKEIGNADLIIDIHNTVTHGTNCSIVVKKPNNSIRVLSSYFNMGKIMIFPPSGALINGVKGDAIALEISKHSTDVYTSQKIVNVITKIAETGADELAKNKVSTYKIYSSLQKSTAKRLGIDLTKTRNLERLPDEVYKSLELPTEKTFVPIFQGSDTEKDRAFLIVESELYKVLNTDAYL